MDDRTHLLARSVAYLMAMAALLSGVTATVARIAA